MVQESSQGNGVQEGGTVKPERFYSRFDEEWTVVGKCVGQKGVS